MPPPHELGGSPRRGRNNRAGMGHVLARTCTAKLAMLEFAQKFTKMTIDLVLALRKSFRVAPITRPEGSVVRHYLR